MRAWLPVVLALPFALSGCPALQSDWTVSRSGAADASADATGPEAAGGSSGFGARSGSSGGSSSAGSGGSSGLSGAGGTGGAGGASFADSGSCVWRQTARCTCDNGAQGAQTCDSSGAYGACECPCGNSSVDPGEQCDGSNLNGKTCASATAMASPYGTLSCTASCTFDTSRCMAALCGNGVIDPGEQCDGADLNSKTCTSAAPSTPFGSLSCTATCRLDTTKCKAASTCSDSGCKQYQGSYACCATLNSCGMLGGSGCQPQPGWCDPNSCSPSLGVPCCRADRACGHTNDGVLCVVP